MTAIEQQKAAKEFAKYWLTQDGYEKGQSQVFGRILGADEKIECKVMIYDCFAGGTRWPVQSYDL